MATPNEKAEQQAPIPAIDEPQNEKIVNESESSSTTKAEHSEGAEGAEAHPHKSYHAHWGGTQVVQPPQDTDESQDLPPVEKTGTYDKIELTEDDCYDELGFGFPNWKKWTIITIIFLVQVSMNFNTSLYSNAISGSTNHPEHIGISQQFGVSEQAARCGAMIFLVFYAFGCELWAPWSEELGRKPILQLSLL
jgi:hypothetical protein